MNIDATSGFEDLNALFLLGTALAAGLLIGVERGWQMRDEGRGSRVAGLRTFGLLGMLGGLSTLLLEVLHPAFSMMLVATTLVILVASYMRQVEPPMNMSITNLVVAILTFGFGMLIGVGHAALGFALAAVVATLLSLRPQLHQLLARLGEADLKAVMRFAIIAGVILPFLPDKEYGPMDAWNPRNLWMVVVVVTGLSLAGYIANRVMGATRGVLVTAVVGGAYSSTAVTASLAQRMRTESQYSRLFSAGIALASAVMYVRVLLLCFLLARFAFPMLLLLLAPATAVAAAMGYLLYRRADADEPPRAKIETRNPVSLVPALGFATMIAVMSLAARWAELRYGGAGIAVVSLIVGSLDVDAATVTLGGLPAGVISGQLAGFVLAMTTLINMLFKAFVAGTGAGWRNGGWAVAALLASSIALAVSGGAAYFYYDLSLI